MLRLAVRSIIELLRLEPQKLLSLHYNRSTIHPENDEDLILIEAQQLYEKMLENFTNKVVINSSDISSISSFARKESSGQNSDDMQTSSSAYLYANEVRTLSDSEDKGIERNLFKERPDVPAGHRMISYPYRGQAWHPNFGVEV